MHKFWKRVSNDAKKYSIKCSKYRSVRVVCHHHNHQCSIITSLEMCYLFQHEMKLHFSKCVIKERLAQSTDFMECSIGNYSEIWLFFCAIPFRFFVFVHKMMIGPKRRQFRSTIFNSANIVLPHFFGTFVRSLWLGKKYAWPMTRKRDEIMNGDEKRNKPSLLIARFLVFSNKMPIEHFRMK